jgi:putative phosphoribosyl transferase
MTDAVEVAIRAPGGRVLDGSVWVPDRAFGVALFAHGSGSGRTSPRNMWVAERLRDSRIATVLFDLLSAEEASDRAKVFDIPLLAERLGAATDHVRAMPECRDLPIGYFGASTGAAAALWAAAEIGETVRAVVSRGGRPDLAGERLHQVTAATLLIVGGNDGEVITLNQHAKDRMRCTSELTIVPGAGHLFEEPGALATVAWIAATWFMRYLPPPREGASPA